MVRWQTDSGKTRHQYQRHVGEHFLGKSENSLVYDEEVLSGAETST